MVIEIFCQDPLVNANSANLGTSSAVLKNSVQPMIDELAMN